MDDDRVDLSNLQRQILHGTPDIGRPKTASGIDALRRLNPDIQVEGFYERLTGDNIDGLIASFDLIVDGSDNFTTRYLLNDACFRQRRSLVSAAILRFDAQITTFKPYLGDPHPCYRCLFPTPPPDDLIPRCDQAGVLGALAGMAGSLQAVEVVKELLGLGDSLSGSLLLYDALGTDFRKVRFQRDPHCPTCGTGAINRSPGRGDYARP